MSESLLSKRSELRQRERRMQESNENCEKAKNVMKQLQEQLQQMKIQSRLDQVRMTGFLKAVKW